MAKTRAFHKLFRKKLKQKLKLRGQLAIRVQRSFSFEKEKTSQKKTWIFPATAPLFLCSVIRSMKNG